MIQNFFFKGPEFCASWIQPSPHHDLYAAILCGIAMKRSTSQIFIDWGLIHILVVSGAHLTLLRHWTIRLPQTLGWIVLLFYCWLTGWGAPVVRAFVRLLLSRRFHIVSSSPLQLEALTTFVVLILVPKWIGSLSFQMSWMCALALSYPSLRPKSQLKVSTLCYFVLIAYSPLTPFSVIANALLVPIIGEWLFPLSLLALVPGPLPISVSDGAWSFFIFFLNSFSVPHSESHFIPNGVRFVLPFLIHFSLIYGEILWRRSRLFSPA